MVIGIKMVHWWFLLEEGWSLDRLFFARSPYNRGEEVPSYCMHLKRHRNCPFHVAKCFAQMAFPMVYNYNILLFITPWPSLTLGRKCEVFPSMWNDGARERTFRKATETFWHLLLQMTETLPTVGALPPGPGFLRVNLLCWLEPPWLMIRKITYNPF